MQRYFFVTTQDPFTNSSANDYFIHITKLSQQGNGVSVFLVQNGITPAIKNAHLPCFDELLASAITIYADIFSLQQRGIKATELKQNIQSTDLHAIIHARLNGDDVIWF
ncbi:DsrE family protein [Cellvibrio japonicus]|uniref:Uncharacterized protein n=1 Tax=Cellvibrio japonicus (strain Ueda107) TaxID=498211 RepID=B3PC87_CELJU|nr:DsrE family protein [Cellvibrio japonicus]ACE84594.1 hypothetical protein CJA_1200 [Cellvibrio japonicus Ueda107]